MQTVRRLLATWILVQAIAPQVRAGTQLSVGPPGRPLVSAPGAQLDPIGVSDGDGGAIVAWFDDRMPTGVGSWFALRVSAGAKPAEGWPAAGVRLAAAGLEALPKILPDGRGGAAFIWSDPSGSIRLQHIGQDGRRVDGSDSLGRIVVAQYGGPYLRSFKALADRAGGGYILFDAFRDPQQGGGAVINMIRIDADGNRPAGWTPVVQLANEDLGEITGWSAVVTATGDIACAFSTFLDVGGGYYFYDAYLEAITRDKTSSSFVSLNYVFGEQAITDESMIDDGTDGVIVRLPDGRTNRLERQDYTFAASWPLAPAVLTQGALYPDGDGGLYALHFEGPIARVNRIDRDGHVSPGWTGLGVEVPGRFDLGRPFDVVSSSAGLFLSWHDLDDASLQATFVSLDGGTVDHGRAGAARGSALSSDASQPHLVPLSQRSTFLLWDGARRHEPADIFVSVLRTNQIPVPAIEPEGPVSGPTFLRTATADGSFALRCEGGAGPQGHVSFTGLISGGESATLDVLDVFGRRIWSERLSPGDAAFRRSIDIGPAARGIYWARLRQGARTAAVRFVLLR